ncbi:MAG: ATP-binding cassette domain-containing protein [Chloroflexota bacterium]
MSLHAIDIRVRVGRTTIVDDVAIDVGPGRVVAIVGPNGAGKSTLLRVLAGGIRPDTGQVTLEGRPLGAIPRAEQARRRAVVTGVTDIAFDPRVHDVVLLGRLPHHGGRPGPRDRAIADAALASVDAGHLADRALVTLSTGERQRVGIARALAQLWYGEPGTATCPEPRWLLLDEPTANLDLRHQEQVAALLRALAADGLGIALVLHDLNLAGWVADEILLLDRGRRTASGSPADVLRPDVLEPVLGLPLATGESPGGQGTIVVPRRGRR